MISKLREKSWPHVVHAWPLNDTDALRVARRKNWRDQDVVEIGVMSPTSEECGLPPEDPLWAVEIPMPILQQVISALQEAGKASLELEAKDCGEVIMLNSRVTA